MCELQNINFVPGNAGRSPDFYISNQKLTNEKPEPEIGQLFGRLFEHSQFCVGNSLKNKIIKMLGKLGKLILRWAGDFCLRAAALLWMEQNRWQKWNIPIELERMGEKANERVHLAVKGVNALLYDNGTKRYEFFSESKNLSLYDFWFYVKIDRK